MILAELELQNRDDTAARDYAKCGVSVKKPVQLIMEIVDEQEKTVQRGVAIS
jgi:hypothetical protein